MNVLQGLLRSLIELCRILQRKPLGSWAEQLRIVHKFNTPGLRWQGIEGITYLTTQIKYSPSPQNAWKIKPVILNLSSFLPPALANFYKKCLCAAP